MPQETFTPFVPPEKRIPEATAVAIGLGLLLGLVMTAANTYLGLYAGMTVSASIPAAVISMGILRGVLRRGTILENNIVQTIASAGESLAAGIIFTVPALVLTGSWHGFRYWPVTMIAALGGLLGVLFMIPLRRALIVEEKELIYPEGLACAEVLEAGERGGGGMKTVFAAMGLGVFFKVLIDGVSFVKGTVEGALRIRDNLVYMGSDMSPALLGVGFIVGPNVAALVFLGGAVAWLVAIPVYAAIHGLPAGIDLVEYANDVWDTQIRYLGVGAMIVGGVWSIVNVRHGIRKGIAGGLGGVGIGGGGVETRTEKNIPMREIGLLLLLVLPFLFGLYVRLAGSWTVGITAGLVMTVSAFFFVAVSSYIVGLVGSSNNPVSGMTICTVLFACAVMLLFGMSGAAGIVAVLGIAGVVCCAVCTAGDVSQDLKTGYLVGATPWKQQWCQVAGAIVPAFIIAPILTVLHTAYGIGDQLRAPQATLFANLTQTVFGGGRLPWGMIMSGAAIGVVIIAVDLALKARGARFRAHIMPVAVGIYLPLSLSTPILLGGLVSLAVARRAAARGEGAAARAQNRGLLFASGLVAGEAVTGVLLATAIFFLGQNTLPITVVESNALSILLFLGVAALLARIALSAARKDAGED
ncbi:MAG: oligopeptide transporter, OPT family [Candidatus Eisenbacteria bacterium]|nr:oligopeptide transporter, OPT family [Candidatus Eisenbacteria bacterium]